MRQRMARFLVVDDDPAAARGMALLLSGDGHDVTTFTRGADAVAALEKEAFDAVFTDHGTHVDGHAVARAARKHRPYACIVVVSARGRDDAQSLIAAGSCLVMDKPVRYDDVSAALAACRERRTDAEPRCFARERDDAVVTLGRSPRK